MGDTELELVERAVAGDEDALTLLLCDLDPKLRARFAPRIDDRFRTDFHIDDILQITYLEAFLRIAQFHARGRGAFSAWMARIAENNLRDAIRGVTRDRRPPHARRAIPPGHVDSYQSLLAGLAGSGTSPSEAYARVEAKEILEAAMARLPKDYCKVVRLFDIDRLKSREVARRLDRSIGAIHMLRCRAHERLAELIGSSSGFFLSRT